MSLYIYTHSLSLSLSLSLSFFSSFFFRLHVSWRCDRLFLGRCVRYVSLAVYSLLFGGYPLSYICYQKHFQQLMSSLAPSCTNGFNAGHTHMQRQTQSQESMEPSHSSLLQDGLKDKYLEMYLPRNIPRKKQS